MQSSSSAPIQSAITRSATRSLRTRKKAVMLMTPTLSMPHRLIRPRTIIDYRSCICRLKEPTSETLGRDNVSKHNSIKCFCPHLTLGPTSCLRSQPHTRPYFLPKIPISHQARLPTSDLHQAYGTSACMSPAPAIWPSMLTQTPHGLSTLPGATYVSAHVLGPILAAAAW